ncbi:DUF5125 domain-containing protein [Dysgonomonas sp. 25]|uniref:DUF5125 domain-containing protein n=1 Tax=Dysgonomonas sp. 25 TaxID=2302933 RepID=UPI0013CF9BA8|nr:DUF5125 domain-containing protein [Dysgonomonas sp. 25]NDV70252.1 DUF5125 domain-containing protein [Dysgonomonas sp. 25]
MKTNKLILLFITILIAFTSCDDDDKSPGNPVMDSKTEFTSAMFGDSLQFTVNVMDDVPLSTLKAQLFYGEDMVSETVIRTKTNDDYTGKIYIPYYANIPNGTATLKLVLQNIRFTITEEEHDLPLTRPDFPYLTFVTENGDYNMPRTGLYEYALTDNLPRKIKGYIKAPAMGTSGNEIDFGWVDNAIKEHSTEGIPFSNSDAGVYSITFNTFNYEAAPFIISYAVNDEKMDRVDDDNYKIDLALLQDDEIAVEGFDDFENWWLDPNFFKKDAGGRITFVPSDGKYRIKANLQHEYMTAEVLDASNNPASLQADGTGAVWVIGDGVGFPSFATNAVGWNTAKALCMVPIGNKKFEILFIAGKTIKLDDINFKFFHQKGWGGEFSHTALTTTSTLVFVGDTTNGRDSGNLGIVDGQTLEDGATYAFVLDLSAGNSNAVLTVEKR